MRERREIGYTSPTARSLPAFVNVSRVGGVVTFTVRDDGANNHARIEMSLEDAHIFLKDVREVIQ